MRNSFLNELVFVTERPTVEHMWELLVSGLVDTLPMLVVNLYYLLRVTQTGLSNIAWMSLLLGTWTCVKLVGSVVWAWKKQGQVASNDPTGIIRMGSVEFQPAAVVSDTDWGLHHLDDELSTPYSALSSEELAPQSAE